jgi:rSAM/selenodomain-associated transferase 2
MPKLSIVLPVLNEAEIIRGALSLLADYRNRGVEVIVADGGSSDGTPDLARPLADRVIAAPRGRATQMNAGAAAATGDVLMFLHCDCVLPDNADGLVLDGLERTAALWGRFDIRIDGRHPLLRIVAAMMNARSRLTGIATGDQAMFVRRDAFEQAGHFPDIPLMEDIALSKALKRMSAPLCLRAHVASSGRRWERNGVLRTIVMMWRLRLAYFLGANPADLAKRYGHVTGD